MAEIVLISPRFDVSFWGLEHSLPIFGKRANMPVAALPLLAALTPQGHRLTLIDENVEEIDYERIAGADLVGVTGLIVQRTRMREILTELKLRRCFTVVGGPWVTVSEDYFGDLADVVFIGEAEETWPRFLDDWQQGRHQHRYEQSERTDMTRVPTPRFDLLKMREYLFGSLQFSRGCPFQCEFCDIIVTFGRRPRLKTGAQVIAELEALRAERVRIVFIVDDNLIGNKRKIKELLREVIEYQEAKGYPFVFLTEASLDLAEDDELMKLMVEANIVSVFIGIESPNAESLAETKKFQNLRPHGTLLERVRRVQDAGLEVWSGMILGFDNDDGSIFEAQRKFIQDSLIPAVMIGMLTAIPKTPLYDRLESEGRLDCDDTPEFGTNIIPLLMSREELREGYVDLTRDLYSPAAYFERVDRQCLDHSAKMASAMFRYWRRHPLAGLKGRFEHFVAAVTLYYRLMRYVPDERLRSEYRRRIWNFMRSHREPTRVLHYIHHCVNHYHRYVMAQQMATGRAPVCNSF